LYLADLSSADALPRPPPASGRDSLTPSELRIADLAGAGQTNRQIAQRLFITQKTVETHLAHAFRKLHIDSRAQIPAALARLAIPGRSRGLFGRRRHLNQCAVRAGEEHAPPVTGLNRASLSHIGGPCRPGELPARGGVAEDDPLGLALAGDFGPGDVRADPDAVSLRADQRGPLGGGLGLLP